MAPLRKNSRVTAARSLRIRPSYRINIPGCTPKTCLGHRGRVKLKFRKVKRCPPYGLYEYSSMKLSFHGQGLIEDPAIC